MADIDADRYLGPRRSFQLEDVREMDVKIVDKALHSCNIVPVSHEPNNDRRLAEPNRTRAKQGFQGESRRQAGTNLNNS